MDFLKPIVSYTAWTPWVWHQQHTLYCRHELSNNGSIVKTEWSESNQDSQPATSTQGVNPSRDVSGFALSPEASAASAKHKPTKKPRASQKVVTVSSTKWMWDKKHHRWYRYNWESNGQRTCEWWKDKYDNIPMTNADFDGDDDDGLGEDDDEDEDEGAGEEHQEPPPAYDSVFGAKKSNRKVKR